MGKEMPKSGGCKVVEKLCATAGGVGKPDPCPVPFSEFHVGVDHSTACRLAFKSCHNFCSRNDKDASELGDCDYTHAELSCLSVYQA